jgi:hypothetical protein
MSFGFAVGDFITAGKLIASIISALYDSRGSSASYQELYRELLSLQHALHRVNSLTSPSSHQPPEIYAIRCIALSVQYPLADFFTKLQKYDSSLGKSAGSGSKVKDIGRKVEWRLGMDQEVKQIRVILSAHVGTVNMMLGAHGLEAMGIEGYKAGGRHDSNMVIARVAEGVEALGKVGQENRSILGRLLGIVTGEVVPQIVSLIEVVGEVLKSNLQIYDLIWKSHTNLPRPDLRYTWFQDPVKLEDALGRVIPVPSEYGYSKLEAIIKDQFKVGPGRQQVMDGDYEIFNTKNSK